MSTVYFYNLNAIDKVHGSFPELPRPLGVKVHFGEEGNRTFIPGGTIKTILGDLQDYSLIESNVLYKGERSQAQTHKEVALRHGFDFAPIDILDGEMGDEDLVVDFPGQHYKHLYLGLGLAKYQGLLVVSHFKGHMLSGFGGAIKNLGMGISSRRGKLAQHASTQHEIKERKCIACGSCIAECPVGAIQFASDSGKARINDSLCISCSKCIGVCPSYAIEIPWASTARQEFCDRLAEYAAGSAQGRQLFFVNLVMNITKDCDCMGKPMDKLTDDIGILASADPVALDQASFDLVVKAYPDFALKNDGTKQLEHAEKLGLGKRNYELRIMS